MNEIIVQLLKDKYYCGVYFPKGSTIQLDIINGCYQWVHGYGDYEKLAEGIDYKKVSKFIQCPNCKGTGEIKKHYE